MSAIVRLFEGHEIRIAGTADRPEWVALDIINILYPAASKNRNHSMYLDKVPEKWKSRKIFAQADDEVTLYEPGLYFLINRSNSPRAIPFQEWICEDVLPSIRKTGSYSTDGYKAKEAELKLRLLTAKTEILEAKALLAKKQAATFDESPKQRTAPKSTAMGSKRFATPTTFSERLLEYFKAHPDAQLTPADVCALPEFADLKPDTARKTLLKLCRRGELTLVGSKRRKEGGFNAPIYAAKPTPPQTRWPVAAQNTIQLSI